jgi:hypothetical protein
MVHELYRLLPTFMFDPTSALSAKITRPINALDF